MVTWTSEALKAVAFAEALSASGDPAVLKSLASFVRNVAGVVDFMQPNSKTDNFH
jgi:hypothetical protein